MKKSILVSYVLVALLLILSLIQGNNEFVVYAGILIPLVIVIHLADKKFDFNKYALWGFALWMLLHMLGGLSSIGSIRTYDYIFVQIVGAPYNILKYDQILHVYTYVVMAGLLGSVVDKIRTKSANVWLVGLVLVLAASGIGAINEILEFMPVVFFNSPGPGGYINTAIDIVANFIGSIIGAWLYLRK